MVIEGGGINGNDDGDDNKDDNGLDDSWWLWNPNPDDDGNEGYNPEEDPYYNTNDDFDGHTGDDDDYDENDEYYKRGKEGLEKIQEDLEKGNASMAQVVNGMLTGLGVGVNANGILISAATCVAELADTKVIQDFGKSLGIAGLGISAAQTAIVFLMIESYQPAMYYHLSPPGCKLAQWSQQEFRYHTHTSYQAL